MSYKIGDTRAPKPKKKKSRKSGSGQAYHSNVSPAARRQLDQLFAPLGSKVVDEGMHFKGGDFDRSAFVGDKPKSSSRPKKRRRSSRGDTPEELLPGLEEAIDESLVEAFLQSPSAMNSVTMNRGITSAEIPDISGLL